MFAWKTQIASNKSAILDFIAVRRSEIRANAQLLITQQTASAGLPDIKY